METPLCLTRDNSIELQQADIGAYLPSYTVIDEHVAEADKIYTDAELDQLDAELGMQPRKKKSKRRAARTKASELPADLKKKLGDANMMYTMDNNLTGAAQVLLEIIRAAPEYPEPYHTLGVIYEELGQRRQALQVFILAAHFTPRDVDQWRRLANLAVDLGETDQALHCLSRIIRMSPSDLEALYHRSIIYRDRGDLKRALDGLGKIVVKAPNTPLYLQAYCPLLFEQGKAHLAQELLEQYVRDARRRLVELDQADDGGSRPQIWDLTIINMLCELYMQQKQFDDAKALLSETVSRRLAVPLAPELSIRFGLCHLCSGEDLSEADRHRYESMIDQIFDLEPSEFAAFYLEVGDLYLSIDLPDKALHILSCLEDLPAYNNADLWFRLARCFKDLPDSHDDAIRLCGRILQEMPNDADSRLLLSEIYRAEGDTAQAIAVLQNDGAVTASHARPDRRRVAMPIDAAGLTLLYQHCQLCLAESKFDDIVEHAFDKVSEAIRAAAMRRRRRGSRLDDEASVSNTVSASGRIRSMPAIMVEGGEFLQTAMIVCRALIAVERFDQASSIVRQLLRFEWPSEVGAFIRDLRCMAIDLFCHRGEYDRAYVQITTAILDMPKAASDSYLMYLLGVILHKLDYPERTRRFLERVINKHPECVSLRVALGHYAVMKHFFTGACREYLRAVSMSPFPVNPCIVLYAAIGLLHRSQSPSVPNRNFALLRAMELFFVYVKRLNRAPHALYNLARAFHSVSINHLAERYYKQAIDAASKLQCRQQQIENHDPSLDFLFSLSLATPAANEANIVRNAAFNLCLIYQQSGSKVLARRTLVQHIEF